MGGVALCLLFGPLLRGWGLRREEDGGRKMEVGRGRYNKIISVEGGSAGVLVDVEKDVSIESKPKKTTNQGVLRED